MKHLLGLALLSGLLLSGCSTSFKGEKRGFTYKVHNQGEFVCLHEPMEVTVKIDKGLGGIMEEVGQQNGKGALPLFPSAKELVTYCRQLLNNTKIAFPEN